MSTRKNSKKRNLFDIVPRDVSQPPKKRQRVNEWVNIIKKMIIAFVSLSIDMVYCIDVIIPIGLIIYSILYTSASTFLSRTRTIDMERFNVIYVGNKFALQPNTKIDTFIDNIAFWISSLYRGAQDGFRALFPRILSRLKDMRESGQKRLDGTKKAILDMEHLYGADICQEIVDFIGIEDNVYDLETELSFIWSSQVTLWTHQQLMDVMLLIAQNNNNCLTLVYDLCTKKEIDGACIIYEEKKVTMNHATKKTYGMQSIRIINRFFDSLRHFESHFIDRDCPITYSLFQYEGSNSNNDPNNLKFDEEREAAKYL